MEHLLPSFLIGVFLASVISGLYLYKRFPACELIDRVLVALAPVTVFVIVHLFIINILSAPMWGYGWNAARLAPTLALVDGYRVYYPPESGPVLSTVYGPVFFLANWPAVLVGSVTSSIIVGSLLSALFYFLPIFLAQFPGKHQDTRNFIFSCISSALFCLFVFNSNALLSSAFGVHPESTAAGLGAFAGIILFSKNRRGSHVWLILSALLAVSGVWAKQTLLPLLIALPVYLWIIEGSRKCWQYLVYLAVALVTVSSVLLSIFGSKVLLFNMVIVPSRHPWVEPGGLAALNSAAKELLVANAMCFIVLLVFYFSLSCFIHFRENFRRWAGENPWFLFVLVSILMIPSSVLGRVKVGGYFSAFNPSLYFLVAAVTLAPLSLNLYESSLLKRFVRNTVKVVSIVLTILLLWWGFPSFYQLPRILHELPNNPEAVAYRFDCAYPGKAYFPANPLPVLKAERKLYHFSYGLYDREIAGFRISPGHFRAHIPLSPELIAFPPEFPIAWVQNTMGYLPEFKYQVEVKTLPGWTVFSK